MGRIAIQLWTVRREAGRSLNATLAKLHECGFDALECGSDLYGLSPEGFLKELSAAGIELCSAHQRLPEPPNAEAFVYEVAQLGAPAVFPSLKAEWFVDETAVARAADRFNSVVPFAQAAGIELGYHNHWWEFERWSSGEVALERFLELLDPAVTVQVDTYWAQVGGVDAAELVATLGNRVHYLHIKDGLVTRDDFDQTAVGDGKMNVGQIVASNPAVQWNIVELDEFRGDIWEAVKRSYTYLSRCVS